jgi:hypothetical protein
MLVFSVLVLLMVVFSVRAVVTRTRGA